MSFRFRVEAGHILHFSRAIGDANPVYADPDAPETRAVGGLLAPPTFAMAAEHADPAYDRRPRLGDPDAPRWFGSASAAIGNDDGPFNTEGGAGFHAEQIFEYHQPLRPGDELTVESHPGRSWSKQGRRGGTLVFTETITELRNQRGELAVTARFIGVSTERPVG